MQRIQLLHRVQEYLEAAVKLATTGDSYGAMLVCQKIYALETEFDRL